MKLDRNTNPDGKGKYALINLRTNQVQWGGKEQFFVIKYKDKFAVPALRAYAKAVREEADRLWALGNRVESTDLREFADEMENEVAIAKDWPNKKLPD